MLLLQFKESQEDEVVVNFLQLIQTLLKDPKEREGFFLVGGFAYRKRTKHCICMCNAKK